MFPIKNQPIGLIRCARGVSVIVFMLQVLLFSIWATRISVGIVDETSSANSKKLGKSSIISAFQNQLSVRPQILNTSNRLI